MAEQRVELEPLAGQLARDQLPVRPGRHQDDRLAAHQAFGGEMADRFAVEIVVLVELDDVPVLAGLGQQLAPGRGGKRKRGVLHRASIGKSFARSCRENSYRTRIFVSSPEGSNSITSSAARSR
jgi:hypothetical protein